jgi:hypothetical protein
MYSRKPDFAQAVAADAAFDQETSLSRRMGEKEAPQKVVEDAGTQLGLQIVWPR